MTDKISLADRMKTYESAYKQLLPNNIPIIVRVDGKSFSKLTSKLDKPFDYNFVRAMDETAIKLCSEIQGAQFAYTQSDEISILINGYKTLKTQPYLQNKVQKITSITAAIASATFTCESTKIFSFGLIKPCYFDSRVFTLPEEEVSNYFLARQRDAIRNSVSMMASSIFNHKQIHKKNTDEVKKMMLEKGKDWNQLPSGIRMGRIITKQTNKLSDDCVRSFWRVDVATSFSDPLSIEKIQKMLEYEKEC